MKLAKAFLFAAALVSLLAGAAFADTLISKPPDGGLWWHPVGNEPSYVYGDCFVAPAGDDVVVSFLGTWLSPWDAETPHATVRFEIWGGTLGGGPDCNNVIAATDPYSTEMPDLNLHTLPVTAGGGPLTPGDTYFFVITGVGMGNASNGSYQTGAHTQNSVYQDNCTFWYSNEATGCEFGGSGLVPEMAFEVTLTGGTPTQEQSWGVVKVLYR